jgi:hypothetical protein
MLFCVAPGVSALLSLMICAICRPRRAADVSGSADAQDPEAATAHKDEQDAEPGGTAIVAATVAEAKAELHPRRDGGTGPRGCEDPS